MGIGAEDRGEAREFECGDSPGAREDPFEGVRLDLASAARRWSGISAGMLSRIRCPTATTSLSTVAWFLVAIAVSPF